MGKKLLCLKVSRIRDLNLCEKVSRNEFISGIAVDDRNNLYVYVTDDCSANYPNYERVHVVFYPYCFFIKKVTWDQIAERWRPL